MVGFGPSLCRTGWKESMIWTWLWQLPQSLDWNRFEIIQPLTDGKVVLQPQGRVSDSDERRYRANHSVWSLTAPNSGGKCRSYTTQIHGNCWWCSIVWDVDLKPSTGYVAAQWIWVVCWQFGHDSVHQLQAFLATVRSDSVSSESLLSSPKVAFATCPLLYHSTYHGLTPAAPTPTPKAKTNCDCRNNTHTYVHPHPFIHSRPSMSLLLRANPYHLHSFAE